MPRLDWPALRAWLRRFGGLGRWLLALPLVLIILVITGQLAQAFARSPGGADTRSQLEVDYRPWPANLFFQPVDPAILTDVFRDEQRLAAASGTAMLPGQAQSLADLLVTSTPTSSATPQPATNSPTPQPTNTPLRPTSTLPPSATATLTASPMPTGTASATVPPPPPPDTSTPIPPPTLTNTPTPTITPTVTNTPVPGFNVGAPDGTVANIPIGTAMIVDLGATPITSNVGDDIVYYESPVAGCCGGGGGVMMDWVTVEVSADGATWSQVFNWGDASADTNITLWSNGYYGANGTAETDNEAIPAASLLSGSGIGIDVDFLGPVPVGGYRYLRVTSPVGGASDAAQLDAIQVLP